MTKYIVGSSKDLEERLNNFYEKGWRCVGATYVDTLISSECFGEINLFLITLEKIS